MTYDVVAVNIDHSTVRLLGTNKTKENAEAVVKMAIMRRGVETEFYSEVPSGTYKEGDVWRGNRGNE